MQLSDRDYKVKKFKVIPPSPKKLTHGIIVRVPNWLGDAIMTLPALTQLKKILPPQAVLAVICAPQVVELFKALPIVNMIIPIAAPHKFWSDAERGNIRATGIKTGLILTNSLRDTIAMRFCGINEIYGAKARFRSLLLKRSFAFSKRHNRVLNMLHHADKYLSMVYALGAPEWNGALDIKIPLHMCQLNREIIDLCNHPKLMVLAAGAAYGAAKRWSSDNYHKVAKWWLKNDGIVVIVGSKSEAVIGNEIKCGLPENKVFNLAGSTDMCELMNLLQHAKICIANDSGVMHLAAILGTSGVAVFGPTDYSATGPISVNRRWKILYEKQCCSPCFSRVCPSGSNACMRAIHPSSVIKAAKSLLKSNKNTKN